MVVEIEMKSWGPCWESGRAQFIRIDNRLLLFRFAFRWDMIKSKAYSFKYVAIFILFFWMIVVMYLSISVNQSSNNVNDSSQDDSLLKALNELDTLRKQNEELQNYATELRCWKTWCY